MKPEIKNKKMVIDFINMFLGVAIIITAITTFGSGTINVAKFPIIFMLGTFLLILNTIKIFPKNKFLGIIFGILSVVMAAALILSLIALI